jgi:hypothetical protein
MLKVKSASSKLSFFSRREKHQSIYTNKKSFCSTVTTILLGFNQSQAVIYSVGGKFLSVFRNRQDCFTGAFD